MIKRKYIKEILLRGLIVSCQALEDEPLHDPHIMGKMALAAREGGAVGIRANSGADIKAIKREVSLPIIGLKKAVYTGSPVYITPTWDEVREVAEAGAEIIALDATDRERPNGATLNALVEQIRLEYPSRFIMADVSTAEEAKQAEELGFDLIGSTLAGYTEKTKGRALPDLALISTLSKSLKTPILAEGGIWTLEQLEKVMAAGAYGAVIGTAITRPREITKRFCSGLAKYL
jgi:N-acylglucosamine-6-phosphate 2-epimerase